VGESIGDATTKLQGNEYQLEVNTEPDMSCSGGAVSRQSKTGERNQHSTVTLNYCAAPETSETGSPDDGDE
jgi:hypothetical protein